MKDELAEVVQVEPVNEELKKPSTPDPAPLDLHRSPERPIVETPETLELLNKSTESRDSKKSSTETSPAKNRRKRKPIVTKKVLSADLSLSENDIETQFFDVESNLPANVIKGEEVRKNNESDECETIDKIAQMVSNITSNAQPNVPSTDAAEKEQPNPNDVLIEDQLEQMFADSKDGEAPPPVILTEPEGVVAVAESVVPKENKKKKTPMKMKAPRKKKTDGEKPDKKKKQIPTTGAKLKNGKPGKKGKSNDIDNKSDVKPKPKENGGKSKVKPDVAPFVQIQKDGTFAIVNQTANGDDDTEKSVNKSKKGANADKNKVIRGLHVSTLSIKYDADKRDTTWVCVFCKLGPHKHKLGDLFGPYIISKTSEDYTHCLQDPAKDIFRQKNNNKFSKAALSPPPVPEKSKKKRKLNDSSSRSLTSPSADEAVPNDDLFAGMSKVDDNNFEVWFHEDCIVWSNGVYIIGTKIIGMEAAIWSCTRNRCAYCEKNGAMLSCLSRDCGKSAHFGCARKDWKLDDDFKTYCALHHLIT